MPSSRGLGVNMLRLADLVWQGEEVFDRRTKELVLSAREDLAWPRQEEQPQLPTRERKRSNLNGLVC